MTIELSRAELRAVTAYAVACARPALEIFEQARPDDPRPRHAIDLAQAFADGGERGKAIRDGAWAAMHAVHDARDAGQAGAAEAARAAMAAAGAAYLHPLAKATQVKHILGAAAHTARALELSTDDGPVGEDYITQAAQLASPEVVEVLNRYPAAAPGGGRSGDLLRLLDANLRPSGHKDIFMPSIAPPPVFG